MESRGEAPTGLIPRALRRLEHRLGARREGRTLWVWLVPAATVVVTFTVLAFIGMQGSVDLALTIPMATVLSLFLGTLSAFYLTAASADERDEDEDEDGPGNVLGPRTPPVDPPPGEGVDATIVRMPGPSPRAAEQPSPVGMGSSSSR